MFTTGIQLARPPGGVHEVLVAADAVELSALVCVPAPGVRPRGVLLALHGGGSRAAYWHRDVDPDNSLLVVGAALGWVVLAVDRPGYGASAGLERARQGLDRQADLLLTLVADLPAQLAAAGTDPGVAAAACRAGVLPVAHSMGALAALRMAAHECHDVLCGVAVCGVPLGHNPRKAAALAAVSADPEAASAPPVRLREPRSYYGPDGSFDPVLLTREGGVTARVPMGEFMDLRENAETLPAILRRVRLPVHWAVGEYDQPDFAAADVLASARRLLAGAPRVELCVQPGVGHNVSLHRDARAYHLRVVAFAEECRAVRTPATADDDTVGTGQELPSGTGHERPSRKDEQHHLSGGR